MSAPVAAVAAVPVALEAPLAGFPGNLTPEQTAAVEAFLKAANLDQVDRVRFSHETHQSFACRLLRARKFEVPESLALLEKIAAWWTSYDVPALVAGSTDDALGNCEESELVLFYPHRRVPDSFDRQGRPLYCEHTGRLDIEALEIMSDSDSLLRWHIHGIAHGHGVSTRIATERLGGERVVDSGISILDLEGFSSKMLSSSSRAHLGRITSAGKEYFPETMGMMFIINAPKMFSMAWNMIKGLLDERTREKIEILGDQSQYLPRLLAFLPADRIPVEYGGTYRVPGGLYPTSTLRHVLVDSGKTAHNEFALTAGQQARVRWFCRPIDMEFTLTVVLPGGPHPVKPSSRSNPAKMHEYIYTAAVPCNVTAVWDNRKGWRSRDVYYRIEITTPEPAAPVPGAVGGAGAA